jgi:cytochrome P450
VLPLLYLHGLSSSDFGPALEQFLGCERKVLEDHFIERVKARRAANGSDLLTVLCQTEDDEGNSFTDDDIVNDMIFLMMAAHDTSTSTTTTMAYHLAAHPEWQDRARDESARLGDGPLDIEALEKLETLDLVTSRCGW